MSAAGKLITGTVRARIGAAYVVVLRNGERVEVTFEGSQTPRIGADVIGVLAEDDIDGFRMRLVSDVTRTLLKGRSKIVTAGRADLTARMVATLLKGAGPAAIRAGAGGLIERTPNVDDPDLAWAISIMEPVAQDLGVALNVIDPLALVRSEWSDETLRDETLPADASGERQALRDLKHLLDDGMRPACSRTIEELARGVKVPSVDFVMPYSPLATGYSWSAEIAGARRNEIVATALPASDARRLSSLREMSRAFAQRYLGDAPADPFHARELEACFADAAAVLAFSGHKGRSSSVVRFQKLREAAVARWERGERPSATSDAIVEALRTAPHLLDRSMDKIFQIAASIAFTHASKSEPDWDRGKRYASDRGIFVDLETAPAEMVAHFAAAYRDDVSETAARIGHSNLGVDRLETFGSLSIPVGFEEEFDAALYAHMPDRARISVGIDFGDMVPNEPDLPYAPVASAPGY